MKTETDKFKDAYQRTCEKLSLATKMKMFLRSESFGFTAMTYAEWLSNLLYKTSNNLPNANLFNADKKDCGLGLVLCSLHGFTERHPDISLRETRPLTKRQY